MKNDNPPKMERSFAFILPRFIRSNDTWIKFGRYTRWLEWRPHLGRYRTVWTSPGWAPKGCPPPEKIPFEPNVVGDKIHINIPETGCKDGDKLH